jgi:hypothetical protein
MSQVSEQPEYSGERLDWMADDAADFEPVCGGKFPENREFNREFCKKARSRPGLGSETGDSSKACNQIPCAEEQGIFLTDQGI